MNSESNNQRDLQNHSEIQPILNTTTMTESTNERNVQEPELTQLATNKEVSTKTNPFKVSEVIQVEPLIVPSRNSTDKTDDNNDVGNDISFVQTVAADIHTSRHRSSSVDNYKTKAKTRKLTEKQKRNLRRKRIRSQRPAELIKLNSEIIGIMNNAMNHTFDFNSTLKQLSELIYSYSSRLPEQESKTARRLLNPFIVSNLNISFYELKRAIGNINSLVEQYQYV